jgi:dTDP-glucose 4,6-dehydratase
VSDGTLINTIDYLEEKGKLRENINDNLYAIILIAHACEIKNIHFTYFGTGCIFDDVSGNSFKEDDRPNFYGSSYSTVKGYTDCLIKLYNVLNIRIRMPIIDIPHPKNFITKITRYKKICSMPNSMTVLPELLPYVIDFMKDKKTGTINLTNPGYITHNEILELYKEMVDPDFTWENFSIKEQNQILRSQRSNNILDSSKLKTWKPEALNIRESVIKTLKNYKVHMITILVTGGCGFIGSHFINYLMLNYPLVKVINIDAMYYCASESNIKKQYRESENYVLYKKNITCINTLEEIFRIHNIDTVIHFAAQSHVDNSFCESLKYTNDNVIGTHTLLEACRTYGHIKKFIHISTDEVYGESMIGEDAKCEQSILCPTNPYAATKAAAELIAQSYYHSFKFPLIITRGNNVFGPNQYPEKVIPKFIKQIKSNQKLTVQGDGSSLRSFMYIKDVVHALDCILWKGEIGEIYNIGSCEEINILNVAEKIIRLKYPDVADCNEYIEFIEDRPFNDKRYFICNEKLISLGWMQNYDFSSGLVELWDALK